MTKFSDGKVRRFHIKAYDGSGRSLYWNITIDHDFFKQKLIPHEGQKHPNDLDFPMEHTFVTTEDGSKYRVILEGVFDK